MPHSHQSFVLFHQIVGAHFHRSYTHKTRVVIDLPKSQYDSSSTLPVTADISSSVLKDRSTSINLCMNSHSLTYTCLSVTEINHSSTGNRFHSLLCGVLSMVCTAITPACRQSTGFGSQALILRREDDTRKGFYVF